jgi:branched-chain amino acid transport system permease protein
MTALPQAITRHGMAVPLAIGTALLVLWPLVFSSAYDLRVFTLAGIYALLVIGYQFVFGHAGALALTQGAFFGLGAYVTGILGARYGLGFLATFPLSVVGPMLLATLVASPVLRLETHYFALATLGIAQVLLLLVLMAEPLTGGANGIPGVPGVELFGSLVPRGLPLAIFVWAWVVAGALLARQLLRGLYGLAFHVMRDDLLLGVCIGLDIGRMRFVAFLLSAAYAGAAGSLFVHTIRVVSPEALEFHVMVAVLAMAVVGGRTRVAGAILGAFLLVHLPEWFRVFEKSYLIVYGAILLATIVLAPEGLAGALERWFPPRPIPVPPPEPLPRRIIPLAEGPLLAVQGVEKSFGGVRALAAVSLVVRHREILGLIGPNGSGKTTLVNVITGLVRPDAGMVRFGGTPITLWRPDAIARRGLARSFQATHLVDGLTALDNVAVARMPAEEMGLRRALLSRWDDPALARSRRHAMQLLNTMGIGDAAATRAGALPHGLRRRLEIARALALQPALLLLDEPAAGLSEDERIDLADRLAALRETGLTLLVVDHSMPFLSRLADRLICLNEGRVIASGAPDAVRADPRVIEAYLGRSEAAP